MIVHTLRRCSRQASHLFKHVIVIVALTALAESPTAHAQNTRQCSATAEVNIVESVAFMKDNAHALKHDFRIGDRRATRRRIRRRFDRKIDEMRYSCAERVLCRSGQDQRVALHAFGIAGRKIRLCYDKMVELNYSFCQFAGIVAHEFGHAIGVKKDRAGGHGRNQNDRVYQFGWFARDLCQSQGLDRPLEFVPADATDGTSTTCRDAVQGEIAWNYDGDTSWNSANVERLCEGATDSSEPARCFQEVMHGGVDWGGGTRWQWENALNLCQGTRDADTTVGCFWDQVDRGVSWQEAIETCR